MRMIFVSTILAFAATVAGIEILTPTIGQKESQDDSITVKWKYVSTDPPKMDIYLVNQNSYPNTKVLVASGVDSSSGQYKIKASDVKDIDTGSGYQVNFVDTNNGGILAQSQQFRVTPSQASDASSSVTDSSTTETSTTTSTTTKHHTRTPTTTSEATTTSNAAGVLMPPNQFGSLLLGLAAFAL